MSGESTDVLTTIALIATIVAAVITVLSFIIKYFFQDQETFAYLKNTLKKNEPLETYHDMIKSVLTKVNTIFSRPFGAIAFCRILLFSFVYPIFFFELGYIISGHNTIGDIEVLPSQPNIVFRAGLVLLLIILNFYFFFFVKNFNRIDDFYVPRLINKLVQRFPFQNPILNELVGFVGFVGFASGVLGGSFTAGIVGLVGGVLGGVLGAISVGPAVNVVSFVGISFVIIVGIGGSVVAGVVIGDGGILKEVLILNLFFLVLPLANWPCDLISFEASRYLTEKSFTLNKGHKILAILFIDLLLAIALLVGTAFLIPIFIETYNFLGLYFFNNFAPIDWKELATFARDFPLTKGLSVTLMLFSTLVWTAIHACFAFFSIVFAPIGRRRIVLYLNQNKMNNFHYLVGATWCTLNAVISLIILFYLPYVLVTLLLKIPIAEYFYDFVMMYHPFA